MKNACKSSHKLSHINEKSIGFTVSWNLTVKKFTKILSSVLELYVYGKMERVILTVQRPVVTFLILNFRRVLIVVSFLLGKSPASVYYRMPTFRNSQFHLLRQW